MARFVKRDGEVQQPKTLEEQDVQYTNLTVDSFESSRDHFRPWFQKASRWYHLYRGYKQGKRIPYRNNITIPIAFSMIQSQAARISDISISGPPVEFIGGGPEDSILARKRTALVNTQFEDMGFFDTSTRLIVGAGIYGVSVGKYTWRTEREMVKFRADLGAGETEYSGEETTFDGPMVHYIRARDFFPQPGVPRIAKMRWVVERFHLDLEDINRLADEGFYLKRGATKVTQSPTHPKAANEEELMGPEDPASSTLEGDFKTTEFQKPIEILQYWGRVPRSMAVDGQVNLVVTVAARKHLLRAVPNPFGRIPFEEYGPMPDPDYFHRPSIMETVEKLQIASNAIASQKLDALQLAVDPVFLYNKRNLPTRRRMQIRPGAFLGFDGDVSDKNVRPLAMDLRGLVNAYTEVEQQMQWMEQGSGIVRDAIQGFAGPDRETARGFLGRQTAANVRVILAARLFERQFVEKMAIRIVALDRRFLELPQQLRMIGTAAIADPLTMQLVPNEFGTISVNELLPDYTARAVGTLRGFSKDAQFQKLMGLMQVAQSNPVAIQMVNWIHFFRHLFIAADIPNPDELLGTETIVQQLIQAQAAGQLEGQTPSAPASAPNTLPQLGAIG